MNDAELAEVLRYSSPQILYIVTWNNLLKKLHCPFQVKAKQNIGSFKIGQVVEVEAVKVTSELRTVYIIKTRAFYYSHFVIIDQN